VRTLGLALLAMGLMTASAANDQPQPTTSLDDAQALAPFFKALADVQSGARTRPVHIIQLGDSHTAADHITGALRSRLQARFGEGGRGALPPGRPYALYSPRQVEVDQSDGWRLDASFVPSNWGPVELGPKPGQPAPIDRAAGPFGLSGWRLVSQRSGASVGIKAEAEARFDRAVVCGLAGPGSGAILVQAAGKSERLDLDAAERKPICQSFAFAEPQPALDLVADGGPVTLLSFATFRDHGGVAVSNFGVIGTTLYDLAARDDALMAAELAAYEPDLIVLAFGTNEGFQKDVDATAYRAEMALQLGRLKRLAPGVPVLVLGPPDANAVRPDIPEDGKADVGFSCVPLSAEEVADYPRLVAERSPDLRRWYPPPGLALVREAQRSAASQAGAAFWDWGARMGGPCSAHHLSQADPRLVRGDHIHFTTSGGDLIAGLLATDLVGAFDAQSPHAPGGK
jgi:lysophospholipase L1-like esterase